jgi:hypothetical protein
MSETNQSLKSLLERRTKTLESKKESVAVNQEIIDEEDEIRVLTRKAEARLKKLRDENYASALLDRMNELEATFLKHHRGAVNFEITLNQIIKIKDFTTTFI